ncbi:zinc finger protein 98-like [Belonocnema kinseyi]|uniref:zinc finger protein 98-like n=1 Tax=Belonocnema kinseyi TaxID=2817044 RepID=UPI00143D8BE2|nr:zinc finger protein 98-like [Belonocnema kinseyi]
MLQDKDQNHQHSASSKTKSLQRVSKISADKLVGEPFSVLRSTEFSKFKTVFVKQEEEEHNLIYGGMQIDKNSITTEISSANNFRAKDLSCLIEYDNDESLDIKEEIIQDQAKVTGQKYDDKYERKKKKQGIKILNHKPENEYKKRDTVPLFGCKFCGKQFTRTHYLSRHVKRVHLKSNTQTSKSTYKCDKCSRSYNWPYGLKRHKLLEHGSVTPQFTCDICEFKTKRKDTLSFHIISKHLNK